MRQFFQLIKEERVGISVLGNNEVEGFFAYGAYNGEEFIKAIKEQFNIELPADTPVKHSRAKTLEYYNNTRKALLVNGWFSLEESLRITYVEMEREIEEE